MSIALIESKRAPHIELVFINGVFLGFIHDHEGRWELEIDEHMWERGHGTSKDCFETSRQGIITWIRKNIEFGEIEVAKKRQRHLADAPDVLHNKERQEREQREREKRKSLVPATA